MLQCANLHTTLELRHNESKKDRACGDDARPCNAVINGTKILHSVRQDQFRGSVAPSLSPSQQLQLDIHLPGVVTKQEAAELGDHLQCVTHQPVSSCFHVSALTKRGHLTHKQLRHTKAFTTKTVRGGKTQAPNSSHLFGR